MSYTNPVDLFQDKPKTKIVCTLGPSSDTEEVLIELIKTGMNVARLNMSHGEKNVHEIVFNRVRKVSKELGIPVGIMSAVWREKKIDIIGRLLALFGQAVPNFLLGLLILYCLSVYFEIMPNSGNYSDLWINPLENFRQMFLPAITLGFSFAASVMRTTRSSMLEVFGEDYIRTARSKGVSEFNIIFRHALRNALIPVVTLSGVELGYLLGGTLIVEEVYALPGLGRLILNAITQRDYALVQGVTLFIAFNFLILGLLADFIYTVLNRRINFNKV